MVRLIGSVGNVCKKGYGRDGGRGSNVVVVGDLVGGSEVVEMS